MILYVTQDSLFTLVTENNTVYGEYEGKRKELAVGTLLDAQMQHGLIVFRVNTTHVSITNPAMDSVFTFEIPSRYHPILQLDKNIVPFICLNFTRQPQRVYNVVQYNFIGSLVLFTISVIGMVLCCLLCILLGCVLAFYKTRIRGMSSVNFKYQRQRHSAEQKAPSNYTLRFIDFIRSNLWCCLGKCNKKVRNRTELRMQDFQSGREDMVTSSSSSALMRPCDATNGFTSSLQSDAPVDTATFEESSF